MDGENRKKMKTLNIGIRRQRQTPNRINLKSVHLHCHLTQIIQRLTPGTEKKVMKNSKKI